MKHWYFLVGSLLVVCSSVSFSSASFLEKETDGNIIKLGSRKIIRQMKRINSAKEVYHENMQAEGHRLVAEAVSKRLKADGITLLNSRN